MELDAFIAQQQLEGDRVSAGRFTISLQEARRKLQDFQLDEPHAYVLYLVSSAVAGGASYIRIEDGRERLVMEFDGQTYSEQELAELYTRLFGGATGPEVELALGLNGALRVATREVVMESHGDGQCARWVLTAKGEKLTSLESSGGNFIRIEVSRPTGIKSFLRSLRGWVGSSAECRLVRARCEHAPVTIAVDGETVERDYIVAGGSLVGRLGPVAVPKGAITIDMRSNFDALLLFTAGRLEVVRRGVSFYLDSLPVSGLAWYDDLDCDLSMSGFSGNAKFDDFRKELSRLYRLLIIEGMLACKRLQFGPDLLLEVGSRLARLCLEEDPGDINLAPLTTLLYQLQEPALRDLPETLPLTAQIHLALARHHPNIRQAQTHYDKAFYLSKELLRRNGPKLEWVSWAARALSAMGGDATALCDWSLFGGTVALQAGQLDAAQSWFGQAQELAVDAPRGKEPRMAAAYLGEGLALELAGQDGIFGERLETGLACAWTEMVDLTKLVSTGASHQDLVTGYQRSCRELVAQYREDLRELFPLDL